MTRILLSVALLVLLAAPAFAASSEVPSGSEPLLAIAADRTLPAGLSSRLTGHGVAPQHTSLTCDDKPKADFDGNGVVNPSDLAIWLNWYFIGPPDPAGDFDNGGLGPSDLAIWLYLYFLFCP